MFFPFCFSKGEWRGQSNCRAWLQIFIGVNPAGLLKDFPCSHQIINLKFLRIKELERYRELSSSEGFAVCLISCHLSQEVSGERFFAFFSCSVEEMCL